MRILRFLASVHPSVYAILLLAASIHSAQGQSATLSSTSHSFGNVAIGSGSAGWTITLRNTSTTTALVVSGVAVTGDFAQTNTCGTVAARGSCAITIKFTPTAAGARSGTLTVTDNATPATQTATLTGTGVAPVSINPTSRSFGNVGIGSTAVKTYTVSNNGTSTLAFSITPSGPFTETDTCSSVAAGASCTINAAFAPTSTGAATGGFAINYSGFGSPLSVTATGTGVAPLTMSPATRAFGSIGVGSASAARTFTVVNNGTTPVALTITPSANFTETDNCALVAAAASCTINSVFAPTSIGAASGTISASYSGFGSPLSVSVTGTGIAPLTLSPTSRAFGNVAVGTTSVIRPFTVANKGTTAQALAITLSPSFTQTNTCGSSLAGGASCTINAAFAPTTATAVTGTLSVSAAGLATPLSAALTGTGIAPVILSPTTLAFSTTQRVGVATAAKTVSIQNTATVPLTIQSIVASPADYTQTNNCGTALAANRSCTVNVIFNPHLTGSIPGTLTISDGAAGSPQVVSMTGTGVLAAIRSVAITPAPASIPKGAQLQFKATATYTNGTTGDVTAISTWASTAPAVFAVVSSTGSAAGLMPGSGSVTATVTGTTSTGTQAVTVTPPAVTSITLSPPSMTVAAGGTTEYSAMGTYSDGSNGALVMSTLALTSDNLAIATINAGGMATGINGGLANIKAASGAVTSALVQLTVTGPTLQSITITPSLPSIVKGSTQQFTATGNYSNATTTDLSTQVAWGSDSANLTVNAQGLATAVAVGPASVTASWNGGAVKGSMTATVIPPPLVSIAVTPASLSVGLGGQQQYTAIGTYSDAATQDITNQVTWVSGSPSIVGITSAGFATVLGTSTTAIPISASSGLVTSNPPAFLSALSTLPKVCPNASLDMKILVVNNPNLVYADLPGIKQILDFVGTPYTVMNYADVTPPVLSDGACHGFYQGIIMAFGDDIYSGNANLYTTLNAYEQTFHVRQVNWFFNPTPDYGFSYSASTIPADQTYSGTFTAAAATVFPNVNTATPLIFSSSFVYLSPPFIPPTGTLTPLVTDASGNILSAIWAPGNGQEVLSQTFDSNQYLMHNLVLAYGLVNWVTKGVFLGDYHVYAAAQVDDFFIADAEWVPGTSCANPVTHDRTVSDDPSLPTFRLINDDMSALVAWQNGLQSDPLLGGFKLSLAFNGVGTTGNKDWTGLSISGVGPSPADDLTYNVHSYEQFFHWMTHTYDHPNTLNGLHKSDAGGDTDVPPVDSIDLEILTNLWVATGASQGGINLDIDSSDNPPNGAVTPINFTDFNPANMVSPGVTGLNDPLVPTYLYADGIRYVVTDTSVTAQTNNGPNPSPNVGIVNSYAPGIYEVPRYPNNIFYNAATWADDQAEFHCIYGPIPGPAQPPYDSFNAAQILDYTSSVFVVNMLKGDMNPQMFHQPNLHFTDNAAALGLGTAHVSSLISDTYDQTFSKYEALYKLPVLSLTLDQLGEGMKARNNYNLAGATGTLLGVGTATPSVSISVPAANPGAVVPVTGLASAGSELYGGTKISHIQIDPGQTVTLPLQ